jgi:hypothetical protein
MSKRTLMALVTASALLACEKSAFASGWGCGYYPYSTGPHVEVIGQESPHHEPVASEAYPYQAPSTLPFPYCPCLGPPIVPCPACAPWPELPFCPCPKWVLCDAPSCPTEPAHGGAEKEKDKAGAPKPPTPPEPKSTSVPSAIPTHVYWTQAQGTFTYHAYPAQPGNSSRTLPVSFVYPQR